MSRVNYQLGFRMDADRCTGCKACVVACKDVHDLPVGYKLRRVVTGEAGTWELDAESGLLQPAGVFSYSVSYSCMHCDRPACLAKCPKKAISKNPATGVVRIDQELCIGCGACTRACPWDAPVVVPRIDGTRKAVKCDFCADLRALGEEPACVAACSMRCLAVTYEPKPDARPAGETDAREVAGGPSGAAPSGGAPRASSMGSVMVAHSGSPAGKPPEGAAPDGPGALPDEAAGRSPGYNKRAGRLPDCASEDAPKPPKTVAKGLFDDALLADAPELGPNMVLLRHRRAAAAPREAVRIHSMPEEFENG